MKSKAERISYEIGIWTTSITIILMGVAVVVGGVWFAWQVLGWLVARAG